MRMCVCVHAGRMCGCIGLKSVRCGLEDTVGVSDTVGVCKCYRVGERASMLLPHTVSPFHTRSFLFLYLSALSFSHVRSLSLSLMHLLTPSLVHARTLSLYPRLQGRDSARTGSVYQGLANLWAHTLLPFASGWLLSATHHQGAARYRLPNEWPQTCDAAPG